MITPEFLSEVVRSTEKAVSVLNQNLIKRISERVSAAFEKKQNLIMPSTISEMMRNMKRAAARTVRDGSGRGSFRKHMEVY